MTDNAAVGIAAFKRRLTIVKQEMPVEERLEQDKAHSTWISDPGVYEVSATSAFVKSKTPGNRDNFIVSVKTATGATADIFVFLYDRDGLVKSIQIQRLLRAFGVNGLNQKAITQVFSDPETMLMLPTLVHGKVKVRLGYYGFVPWYLEKGVYGIVDFSKKAGEIKDMLVIDPVNNDIVNDKNREAILAYMTAAGMKKGDKTWDFIEPAPDFELSAAQIEAQEAIVDFLGGNTDAAPMQEASPAKELPKKPAFLLPKK
jgi:hypothetical protein